jgi:hypothetical protein
MQPKIQAEFIHVGFYDLICDSIFHYRQSQASTDSYMMNRNARASILSSTLSLECFANALIQNINASKDCMHDLDKMTPLNKIEMFFRIKNSTENISYSDHLTQKIKELIQIRNSFVHTKRRTISTAMGLPEDNDTHWIMPMELDGELYKALQIPKSSMFWSADNALDSLKTIFSFYKKIFKTLDNIQKEDEYIFYNHITFKNVIMSGIFTEFDTEIEYASSLGLETDFLKLK